MGRVLVTEKLAQPGLDLMAAAGHEVDVQLGLSPEELVEAIVGAHALVIRSATTVTAEVLAAGTDLVVVGRAGIGLDNVDVAAATERGVMVVNAPQSNILSAAEQAMALLLAQARNIPQAHAALVAGKWERSKWEGVELHGKTLGVVGLGRVGALVAQRALAFGMRLVAYDPFVSDRPGPAHGRGTDGPRPADGRVRLRHGAPPQEQGDPGADRGRHAGQGQAGTPDHQHRPGRHRRRGRPGRGHPHRTGPGRRPRRLRQGADHRVAAVRAPLGRGRPPPRGVDGRGPGQGRGDHRRAGHPGPGRGLRPVRRQRRRHRRVRDGPPVHGAGRAARPHPLVPRGRAARRAGDRVPGRTGRRRAPGSSPCRS